MAFTPVPRITGALAAVAATSAPPEFTSTPRLTGAGLVVDPGFLGFASPRPELKGAVLTVDPGFLGFDSPIPRLTGALLTPSLAPAALEPAYLPRLTGSLTAATPTAAALEPAYLPRLTGGSLAVSPGFLGFASPRPALLGSLVTVSSLSLEASPVPRAQGALVTVQPSAPTEPAYRPQLTGALVVVSSLVLAPTPTPRATGGVLTVDLGFLGFPSDTPRLTGAAGVLSFDPPAEPSPRPALYGALVTIERSEEDGVPLFTSAPPLLTGSLVVVSFTRPPQFDATNHATHLDWRNNDHLKLHDAIQLFDDAWFLECLLNIDHDTTDGSHAPIPLSRLAQETISTNAPAFSGTQADSYNTDITIHAGSSALFEGFFHAFAQTPASGGLVETLTGHNGSSSYRLFHAFSGGVISGTSKLWHLDPGVNPAGDPVTTMPDLYDAAVEGEEWAKNHYAQILQAQAALWASFDEEHTQPAGLSEVAIDNGFQSAAADWSGGYSANGTPILLAAHGGLYPVALHYASTAPSMIVVRSGFDDTSVYAVIESTTDGSSASGVVGRSLLIQTGDPANPSAPSPSTVPMGAIGYSAATAVYTRLRDIIVAQLARYDLEHDLLTGRHSIPMSRLSGWSVVGTFAATVSSTIGVRSTQVIEAFTGTYKVYFASAVGAAGSGIATFSIGVEGGDVILISSRITEGASNSFTVVVYGVADA